MSAEADAKNRHSASISMDFHSVRQVSFKLLSIISWEADPDCPRAGMGSDARAYGVDEDVVDAKLFPDQVRDIVRVLRHVPVYDTDGKGVVCVVPDAFCHIVDNRG